MHICMNSCVIFILVTKLYQINDLKDIRLNVPQMYSSFQEKFDKLQEYISTVSVLDELLAGK